MIVFGICWPPSSYGAWAPIQPPSPQAFITCATTGWTKTFPSRNSGGFLSISARTGKSIPRLIRMAVSRTMSKVSLPWSAKQGYFVSAAASSCS